jgi:hypothetical protein
VQRDIRVSLPTLWKDLWWCRYSKNNSFCK